MALWWNEQGRAIWENPPPEKDLDLYPTGRRTWISIPAPLRCPAPGHHPSLGPCSPENSWVSYPKPAALGLRWDAPRGGTIPRYPRDDLSPERDGSDQRRCRCSAVGLHLQLLNDPFTQCAGRGHLVPVSPGTEGNVENILPYIQFHLLWILGILWNPHLWGFQEGFWPASPGDHLRFRFF